MKVRIVGSFSGTSGYSAHTRGLSQALLAHGVDVRISTMKGQDYARGLSDAELKMLDTPPEEDEIMIYIGTPQYWRYGLAEKPKKFIGVLVFEGSSIPSSWLEYLADPRVDQVWVPSQHVYDAVKYTWREHLKDEYDDFSDLDQMVPVHMDKVKIIPHGFDPGLFNCLRGSAVYESNRSKRKFSFIANKGFVHPFEDRGGLQYVIKAFHDEFTAEENVRLLVKINGAYINPPDKNAWIREMVRLIGCSEKRAEMQLTLDPIPADQLKFFYGDGDVFVSAVRAEGFNLTGLEAKACGLPTIMTGYGGQTDYMEDGVDWKIPYTLAPVTHDVAYEEVSWATPDIAELRKFMRYCFEHQDEVAQRGLRAAKGVQDWTWNDAGAKALIALNELVYSDKV